MRILANAELSSSTAAGIFYTRKTGRERISSSAKAGGTAGASQHAGRRDLVTAGRAIEPVMAVLALRLGKPLFLFAFGAQAVHLAFFDVFGKQQAATGAFFGVPLANFRTTIRLGAVEYRSATAAAVLPFFQFLADRAFFHG
jgi:hypothetical protein